MMRPKVQLEEFEVAMPEFEVAMPEFEAAMPEFAAVEAHVAELEVLKVSRDFVSANDRQATFVSRTLADRPVLDRVAAETVASRSPRRNWPQLPVHKARTWSSHPRRVHRSTVAVTPSRRAPPCRLSSRRSCSTSSSAPQ